MNEISVNLVLPEKSYPLAKAKQVMVPLIDGYATIMPDHTSFLSILGTGIVTIEQTNDVKIHHFVSGGFIEVFNNQVNLLADVSEQADEIDVGRAMLAKTRAENRLKVIQEDTDLVRAQAALLRASTRVDLNSLSRGR